MKIQALTLAGLGVSSAAATSKQLPTEIAATSDLGRSLLSKSRRLDDGEEDTTWIAGYSLKFQGCHHHASYNADVDDEDDVRVKVSKLAHFRLCPADSCSTWLGAGCSKGYGDYVVDLTTFAKTFVESQKRAEEYTCQMFMYENCDCTESDDKDDNFNREYCEYDCYNNSKNGKMKSCIDRDPYNDDEESRDEFRAEEFAECKEFEQPEFDDDDANNNRRLDQEEEEVQYYIGPYCTANGGAVHLGLYTDDTCTEFADENSGIDTYKTLTRGESLPFSTTSLVSADCVSCIEQEDPNRQDDNGDDAYDNGPEVSNQCAELYESAGKCESSINHDKAGKTSNSNDNACGYINGIQFTKLNGMVDTSTSKLATFFIVAFAAVCVGLAGFVYKLKKQVDQARATPLLD